MQIQLRLNNDRITISTPNSTLPVSSNPAPGSSLPAVSFKNTTDVVLDLSFSSDNSPDQSPFTATSYTITAGGTVNPQWKTSVQAESYSYSVDAETSKRTAIHGATGDINIQVQTA